MMNIRNILDLRKRKFLLWRSTTACLTGWVRLRNGMTAICLAEPEYIIRGRLLITSITNVFPKHFWSRTSGNEIIGELFNSADTTFADNLLRLLQGSTIQAIVDTDIIYPEINGDIDTIYSFLLVAGYLCVSEHIGSLYDNPICALSIPNYEIKSVFQKEIIDRYNGIFTGAAAKKLCGINPYGKCTFINRNLAAVSFAVCKRV